MPYYCVILISGLSCSGVCISAMGDIKITLVIPAKIKRFVIIPILEIVIKYHTILVKELFLILSVLKFVCILLR